jgi:hypothetical protein
MASQEAAPVDSERVNGGQARSAVVRGEHGQDARAQGCP